MNNQLKVSIGQYSHKGRKEINQDLYNCQKYLYLAFILFHEKNCCDLSGLVFDFLTA